MSGYWPTGIDISDTGLPKTILETARDDWEKESGGLLTLLLQETESQSGNKLIVVHAKHIPGNRTATLFSVVHRPDNPYPVAIQPEEKKIPDFLKKSYPKFDFSSIHTLMEVDKEVHNKWVSDTPSEFRLKLQEAFNLGSVKSEVTSLISHSPPAEDETLGDESDGPPSGQE